MIIQMERHFHIAVQVRVEKMYYIKNNKNKNVKKLNRKKKDLELFHNKLNLQ